MPRLNRRTALVTLATGGLLGLGYVLRSVVDPPVSHAGPGMGGASGMDMRKYMNMFMRHTELTRSVEDVPGGVRTTTESHSPDLAAELQAHVSSMYVHLDQATEVVCMSSSLPTLFRRAADYRRELSYTPNGVVVVETASDPDVIAAIREHAREVTGFVDYGMPAMMRPMMGGGRRGHGMMGGGGMGPGMMGGS